MREFIGIFCGMWLMRLRVHFIMVEIVEREGDGKREKRKGGGWGDVLGVT